VPEDEFDGEFEDFEEDDFVAEPLDEHEAAMVARDLADLADFEETFAPEGYRGVAVFCHDCVEEHLYPWGMLRENLTTLIETGETPVHEPAFAPEPDRYIPWDYARGYVDALRDAGVSQRLEVDACPRCGFSLDGTLRQGNFCPRCGTPLLAARLQQALTEAGLSDEAVAGIVRRSGFPGIGPRRVE
jgi:hypothetical protein